MCALVARDPKRCHLSQIEAQSYYSPDSWQRLLTALTAADNLGTSFEIECDLRLSDGSLTRIRQGGEANVAHHQIIGSVALYNSQVPSPFDQNAIELLRLLDALEVGILCIDSKFRYQFANQTYLNWFGLKKNQIIGKHLTEVIGPAAFKIVRSHIEQSFLGKVVSYEAQLPYPSGGARQIFAQLQPMRSGIEAVLGCYAMIQDITQRKIEQEQLRINEERWQLALESSGDGVWDWYPQSDVEIFSKRLKEIYGYREDEISDLSTELDQRTHPDDLAEMRLAREAHFEGVTPIYINEHRVLCRDGLWKWILTRGTVVQRSADGKPVRVVGTHTEISERKHAEAALRASEERLRMALSATHQGLYDLHVQTGIAIVNTEYATMLGYEHATFDETITAWLARMHPDDRQACKNAYTDYIDGKLDEYRIEFRQKKHDSEWVWILSVGAIVESDERGKPLRMLGTHLDITEKKRTEAMIWQQANIDSLTNLPNRRMFYDRLEHDIQKSKRSGLPLAVLFIDLDHFKEVNDTLGHATGDALLIEAAHRLRLCVRESDTVARLGGDEFTVSLPDQHDAEHIETIAQNIVLIMSRPFLLGNEEVYLSASIGITLYPHDADKLEDLIKHADQAMYAAKDSGRNRFSYFTPSLQTAAIGRMRLTSELRTAIAEQHLKVHFQAIVDLATGKIHKAEALVRWPHAQRGWISPIEFIPIAEANSLIVHIGEWVFQQTVHWVQTWRAQYHAEFQISVNQSPLEFQGDVARYTNWIGQLKELGLPGQAISVEITEGLLLDAGSNIIEKLLQFRDAGIQVALDDFGTGYSSLSYLKKFDIDYLKIDQSFICNLTPQSSDMALCEAIIVMAHKLGLKVIAEGVETAQQKELLLLAGCDYAQGYLFAKPLPPEEFEVLLKQQK